MCWGGGGVNLLKEKLQLVSLLIQFVLVVYISLHKSKIKNKGSFQVCCWYKTKMKNPDICHSSQRTFELKPLKILRAALLQLSSEEMWTHFSCYNTVNTSDSGGIQTNLIQLSLLNRVLS